MCVCALTVKSLAEWFQDKSENQISIGRAHVLELERSFHRIDVAASATVHNSTPGWRSSPDLGTLTMI